MTYHRFGWSHRLNPHICRFPPFKCRIRPGWEAVGPLRPKNAVIFGTNLLQVPQMEPKLSGKLSPNYRKSPF